MKMPVPLRRLWRRPKKRPPSPGNRRSQLRKRLLRLGRKQRGIRARPLTLTMGQRLVESDLAAARCNYVGLNEELLMSEIARGAVEEAEKKVCVDLEVEQAHSCNLFDDIDRLKKPLLVKEDAILQSGKLIEDLRVDKTELARSYKKIEKPNTDLVGENMTLEERIRGRFSMLLCFLFFVRCSFSII
jgi:hypothetical protein